MVKPDMAYFHPPQFTVILTDLEARKVEGGGGGFRGIFSGGGVVFVWFSGVEKIPEIFAFLPVP